MIEIRIKKKSFIPPKLIRNQPLNTQIEKLQKQALKTC